MSKKFVMIKPAVESPLFKLPQVGTYTSISRSKLYSLISEDAFPKAIRIGTSTRWLKAEIDTWLTRRVSNR